MSSAAMFERGAYLQGLPVYPGLLFLALFHLLSGSALGQPASSRELMTAERYRDLNEWLYIPYQEVLDFRQLDQLGVRVVRCIVYRPWYIRSSGSDSITSIVDLLFDEEGRLREKYDHRPWTLQWETTKEEYRYHVDTDGKVIRREDLRTPASVTGHWFTDFTYGNRGELVHIEKRREEVVVSISFEYDNHRLTRIEYEDPHTRRITRLDSLQRVVSTEQLEDGGRFLFWRTWNEDYTEDHGYDAAGRLAYSARHSKTPHDRWQTCYSYSPDNRQILMYRKLNDRIDDGPGEVPDCSEMIASAIPCFGYPIVIDFNERGLPIRALGPYGGVIFEYE